jgi:catechol 2,3-dioxygenase-like lactoylglutathione lyase family enzyme
VPSDFRGIGELSRGGADVGEPLNRISAMSLFVEDVQKAKAFYGEVFGVEVVYEDDVSAALQFENVIINLLSVSEAAGLVEPGAVAGPGAGSRFQLSIWVQDVDAVCADLEKRGVTLLHGPVDKEWGMRVATFTDPAGHSWEVAQQLGG